jgi:hypothetical protein
MRSESGDGPVEWADSGRIKSDWLGRGEEVEGGACMAGGRCGMLTR